VFAPLPDQGVIVPVYAYGHGTAKDPVFTCPVSVIPEEVWTVIDLWLTCRAMKALPVAGGVLDQPLIVRRAWPVLEAEMAPHERRLNHEGQMAAMARLLGVVSRR
jgi:hypothetical protein